MFTFFKCVLQSFPLHYLQSNVPNFGCRQVCAWAFKRYHECSRFFALYIFIGNFLVKLSFRKPLSDLVRQILVRVFYSLYSCFIAWNIAFKHIRSLKNELLCCFQRVLSNSFVFLTWIRASFAAQYFLNLLLERMIVIVSGFWTPSFFQILFMTPIKGHLNIWLIWSFFLPPSFGKWSPDYYALVWLWLDYFTFRVPVIHELSTLNDVRAYVCWQ